MEEPYFCAICGRRHMPYVGLIYTQHLPWRSSERALEEARRIWIKIIDSFEQLLPQTEIYVERDVGVALASIFHKSNFPVEIGVDRAVAEFGRLRVVIWFAPPGAGDLC